MEGPHKDDSPPSVTWGYILKQGADQALGERQKRGRSEEDCGKKHAAGSYQTENRGGSWHRRLAVAGAPVSIPV